MDKELKGLVVEIISIVILLIIVVPICVSASSQYQEKKDAITIGNKASVDISNKGVFKEVKVFSGIERPVKVNLIMRITKFNDEYIIHLDDQVYNLNELEYYEDENYQYYNLGVFDVEKKRTFQFRISAKDRNYYNETISYGFFTEGLV